MDAIGLRPRHRRDGASGSPTGATSCSRPTSSIARDALERPRSGGRPEGAGCSRGLLREGHAARAGADPDLAEQDIPIYLAALRGLDGVYEDTVAAVGYCMGARLAVRAAGLDPEVAAVGGFHGGGLVTEDERSPHRGIPRARAEFLFGHADHDRSMPPEAVEELRRVLDEAGLAGTSVVYAGAAHGYTMADTPMYDESATERHFIELEELLDRTL